MKKMEQYKKIYWDIKLSDRQVEKSWQELAPRLTHVRSHLMWLKYSFAALSLVAVLLTGVVGLAQASEPGSPLYPVKILSDKVVAMVTGKPEINLQRRAADVIETSKKQPQNIDEASKQYQKALDDTEKEVQENEGKKNQLRNSLNKQEAIFKEAIKNNPHSQDKLEKVIQKTEDAKEKLEKHKDNR